ncbi:phosphotransferase [Thermoactinomyces vulgaris]|jgi:aminoglycoside 2''-phosphotransferase|uniref:phosphotransferase n=2 Tax=Thermoactinomyces TaxID=2023 RepID=UPI0011077B6F|nr:phosphotransferase [Thermoactinomyces vulgaris]QCV56718.1 DUF1679 domain-containing protein [Thermoactinomyces vulgaris]
MANTSIILNRLQWISAKCPNLNIQYWKVDNRGWDNLVIVINDSWIFRFPRNSKVQKRLLVEKQLLDHIKDLFRDLDVEVPRYQLLYDSADELPVCCFYPMIKGAPLSRKRLQALSPPSSRKAAHVLGDALALLHSINVSQLQFHGLLPEQTEDDWKSHWSDIKLKVLPLLTEREQYQVRHLFENFFEEWSVADLPKTLIHGDLSHSHILFSEEQQRITGIIDFGDAKIGDPAYDFSGLYWDYGNHFLLQVLDQYNRHTQLPYDTYELYRRVSTFYGKRQIFYDILHGLENNSPSYVKRNLQVLRQSLLK